MEKKTVYLFDNKKGEIPLCGKTLKPVFLETSKANFEMAVLRNRVLDYDGAILFLDRCIKLDAKFQNAYELKMLIFLNLNQFENAMLNLFKSVIIDKKVNQLPNPKIYDFIYKNVFTILEIEKLVKIRDYVNFCKRILDESDTYNEFAEKLVKQFNFEINYNNFITDEDLMILNLEDIKTVC